jgi:putative peptidoglycan lipid II flippase
LSDGGPREPRRDHARDVVRQSSTTSVAAGLGVASGLLLDVAIAAGLGAGTTSDAFFVAARIPLGIEAIILVAANQALVPTVSTWLVRAHEREAWRRSTLLLLNTLLLGGALAIVAALVSEPLMRLTAPGLSSASIEAATRLSRILFLIVPLVAMAEVLRAVLNAQHSFVAPALMPVFLNGVAAAIILVHGGHSAEVVAWAYVAGAGAQLIFLAVAAWASGFRPRLGGRLRDPEIVAVGRLSVRPVIGAGLNPVARIGEQAMISFLPAGSITILSYGYRLISAIGGSVLFRSVIVVILPRLTKATATDQEGEVRQLTRLGVLIMLVISVPLTAGTAILARPAMLAIFHRGFFTAADADVLGVVLAVYAASLVGSALQRALLAPFFARLDTRVPLRNTAYGVLANLALVPVFVLPLRHSGYAVVGVAIAYSLAQYVNVGHAWYRLVHDLGIRLRGIWDTVVGILLAGVAMAGALLAAVDVLDPEAAGRRWGILLRTAVAGVIGVAAFAIAAAALGLFDLRRRFGRLRGPIEPPDPGIDSGRPEVP